MPKIHIMNDLLANKIAAGEVVERPASVVKELVENSLDAGATAIEIDLQQGGLEWIRVADNGSGIDPEDVPLAFERHATSKIRDDRDLFRIASLGFRGEALPSIAAVSRIELKTRQDAATAGSLLRIEGGKILENGAVAARKGTELVVKDLFFNTPARLKYLKSIQTELGHAVDYIEKMALVRPDVAFRLTHNDRLLLQTPGDGNIAHAIATVYGREYVKQMVELKWNNYDYRITGMTGYPELNRANRNHTTFFVNGRYIKSYPLFNAVQTAYHTLLPINRYPVCVLHVQLDPSLVDCNVHPTKLEVRFSEEKDVFQAVQTAVHSALATQTFIPKASPSFKPSMEQTRNPIEKSDQPELKLDNPIQVKYESSADLKPQVSAPDSTRVREERTILPIEKQRVMNRVESPEPAAIEAAINAYRPVTQEEAPSPATRMPKLRPVAQVLGMYVVAENEQGLFIIDQHAAHEKVLYEKFSKKMAAREIRPLPLLVPLTLDLSASDAQKLEKQLPILAEYHLEIERFGGDTYIVRSVPDIWAGQDPQRLTFELIDEILAEGLVKDPRVMIEDKLISKSCKSAIKANQWLSMPEMVALCDQLSELDNPFTCPHGRPIIIHMTRYDLEKQFKRVM